MDMRTAITLVEGLSRHATLVPGHMHANGRTPVGKHLFHGTTLLSTLNILKQNVLNTGANWRGEGDRVPTTRSYEVAKKFGQGGDYPGYRTVLVLDWKKLADKYTIIPYQDVDHSGQHWNQEDPDSEQEEAVYGNIRPLNQFLVSVNIDPVLLQQAHDDVHYADYVVQDHDFFGNRRGFRGAIERLRHSPLLNAVRH